MTLLSGDLTTPQRVANWLPNPPALPSAILSQLITSMTGMLYNKISRARTYSQTFTRTLDGVGNYQILLPDYPVTSITSIQMGAALIQPSPLPNPANQVPPYPALGYGYRWIPWSGNLPGEPAVLEFVNGYWWQGVQNIKIIYTAGYLIQNEPWTVPGTPFKITVLQPQGVWCRDNGVVYAATGVALVPVTTITAAGQYIPPTDALPGVYTFGTADTAAAVLISYSFVPSDLEEACIQMVAERYDYRSRVGVMSKALGGQETVSFLRGGRGNRGTLGDLPPEVAGLIEAYISVIPPAMGAPL